MNCKAYRKLMEEYLEGSLEGAMKDDFDAHLRDCQACRELVSGEKALSGSIAQIMGRTTGVLALRPDVHANILSAVAEADVFRPFEEMMGLFDQLSFPEKVRRVLHGLKQPPESGEHKWARLQMLRLSGPIAGVVVPALVLLIATLIVAFGPEHSPAVQVTIREEKLTDDLKEIEPPPEPEIQPPDPSDIVQVNDTFIPSTSKETSVGPDADFSPQPSPFDAVAIIKSPVIMKGVFGNRSPGARGSALGRFGGSGATEGAVLRALRWLKKHQESDGSWTLMSGGGDGKLQHTTAADGAPVGITGLGLLAFLAHGETPASPEFGRTVQGAIQYLLEAQLPDGTFKSKEAPKNYSHLTAAYALCEAYGMTKVPTIRTAAEKAMDVIVRGQHPNGGWDYMFKQSTRDDITFGGWCCQALKAAKIAGIGGSPVDEAMKKAIDNMKAHQGKDGFFGYTGPQMGGAQYRGHLTGAGVLSLQLLGAGNCDEARQGLTWMDKDNIQCKWDPAHPGNPIYYWYYITQAKFHAGGETWKNWNKQFSPELVKNQTVIPKAIEGPGGKMVDIGYWKPVSPSEWAQGYTYNTTLCALMLQVYYRYLPTYQKPEELVAEAGADNAPKDDAGVVKAPDLEIDIKM